MLHCFLKDSMAPSTSRKISRILVEAHSDSSSECSLGVQPRPGAVFGERQQLSPSSSLCMCCCVSGQFRRTIMLYSSPANSRQPGRMSSTQDQTCWPPSLQGSAKALFSLPMHLSMLTPPASWSWRPLALGRTWPGELRILGCPVPAHPIW